MQKIDRKGKINNKTLSSVAVVSFTCNIPFLTMLNQMLDLRPRHVCLIFYNILVGFFFILTKNKIKCDSI